jgi:hypothetical protein
MSAISNFSHQEVQKLLTTARNPKSTLPIEHMLEGAYEFSNKSDEFEMTSTRNKVQMSQGCGSRLIQICICKEKALFVAMS